MYMPLVSYKELLISGIRKSKLYAGLGFLLLPGNDSLWVTLGFNHCNSKSCQLGGYTIPSHRKKCLDSASSLHNGQGSSSRIPFSNRYPASSGYSVSASLPVFRKLCAMLVWFSQEKFVVSGNIEALAPVIMGSLFTVFDSSISQNYRHPNCQFRTRYVEIQPSFVTAFEMLFPSISR